MTPYYDHGGWAAYVEVLNPEGNVVNTVRVRIEKNRDGSVKMHFDEALELPPGWSFRALLPYTVTA